MRTLLAIPALLLLAGTGPAQTAAPFDPGRDLEGFEDCDHSDFSDLYPLDEFLALAGKQLGAEELATLRRRWNEEREKSETRIAAIQADPRELVLHNLRKQIAKTSYFSKISWTEDRGYPPFVFYVQKPAKEDPAYAANVARFYGPWLQKLERVYDASYVKPLALTRRDDYPVFVVCILASPGDLENFERSDTNRQEDLIGAVYQPHLRLVVGCENPFDAGIPAHRQRFPILHECVLAMQHATCTGGGTRPVSLWLHEGLAAYLAWHEGLAPDALDRRAIQPRSLAAVVSACTAPEKREVLLFPVEDLVQVSTVERLEALAKKRATDQSVAQPERNEVLSVFLGQSALWMRFLQDGEGSKHRDAFLKYVKSAMGGAGGLDVFRMSFAGTDLAALDRAFFEWVYKEHERVFPKVKLDHAPLAKLFEGRTPGADAAGAAAAEASASGDFATALPTARFSPAALAIDPQDVEAAHALALVRARGGDVEGGKKALDELASRKPAEPEASRIARDVVRLAQLVRLRDGFLDSLRQSGAKWTVEHEGRKVLATVVLVKDGFVLLGENKQHVPRIPLSALAPLEIARQADKMEEQGGAEPWTRAFALLLGGDPKWDRYLKDPGDPSKDLREDARTWIPQLLRAGEAATVVDALSKIEMPKTREEAAAICEPIRALLASHGDALLVQKRLEPLKRLAGEALTLTYTEQDPSALVHGRYTFMGNGAVNIVYEFDRKEEGEDFRKQPGYLKEWRKVMEVVAQKEEQAAWTVQDSGFQGEGAACYRYLLGFEAPMTVRYELAYISSERSEKAHPVFVVGLCDDGARSNILAINLDELRIVDRASNLERVLKRKESFAFHFDVTYRFEIRHDGSTVSMWLEGEKVQETPCGPRRSGGLFLWFHTVVPLAIKRLEIEGRLDQATRENLRAEWVKRKLAEMGFK